MARAFWWASLASVTLLSTEAPLLPLLGVLLLGVQMSARLGSLIACGILLLSHPWQSADEDTTSATSSSSLRGDPGSLQSLYTS